MHRALAKVSLDSSIRLMAAIYVSIDVDQHLSLQGSHTRVLVAGLRLALLDTLPPTASFSGTPKPRPTNFAAAVLRPVELAAASAVVGMGESSPAVRAQPVRHVVVARLEWAGNVD